jgi:hypothetical protein
MSERQGILDRFIEQLFHGARSMSGVLKAGMK